MPGRNIVKLYAPESFYHVYNRGVNKRVIFKDAADYQFFLSLFARYLSPKETHDARERPYPHMRQQIDLLAYCLMPNHFHLMVYQKDSERAMAELLHCISTTYTMYFNKRYRRRGPLFENHYRGVLVQSDAYLQHISRYIHLNPRGFKLWPYSSYSAYADTRTSPEWLEVQTVLGLFDSPEQYLEFVDDYEDAQQLLGQIKRELADY